MNWRLGKGLDGVKLPVETADVFDSKFWITFMGRLQKVLTTKRSDCENCTDPIMIYRAQGSATMLKRVMTIEVKNTLKDLGVPVPDAPKKY